jgi:hypothetical protein
VQRGGETVGERMGIDYQDPHSPPRSALIACPGLRLSC